jgi:hypothetical protein
MPGEGAGAATPPAGGAGTATPPAGGTGATPPAGGEKTFTQAQVQEMVQNAIDETTGRWSKKLGKVTTDFEAKLEEATKKVTGTGEGGTERATLKQLETNLALEAGKRTEAEKRADGRGNALKRFGLISELEAAKAAYPSQVAELLAAQVALDENDALYVPDKDGDPKLNAKTGKPYTVAEIVAEHKLKFPRLYLDSTSGGSGFSGSGGSPASLDARIAEAEAKGDWNTANALKAEKLKGIPVKP